MQLFLRAVLLYSDYVMNQIKQYVSYIAPIVLEPGEFEMDSLGTNAYLALTGKVERLRSCNYV